jgi:hypothetical protein
VDDKPGGLLSRCKGSSSLASTARPPAQPWGSDGALACPPGHGVAMVGVARGRMVAGAAGERWSETGAEANGSLTLGSGDEGERLSAHGGVAGEGGVAPPAVSTTARARPPLASKLTGSTPRAAALAQHLTRASSPSSSQ